MGGPFHEPGGSCPNVWWGKGSQVRENHKHAEPVESIDLNCVASLCDCSQ